MPYLGSTPNASFSTRTKQDFTANGSTTAFTLSSAVASANDIEVFVGNVRQEPTDAYTVSGTTLTMSAAPASGLNFYVVFKGLEENSVVPADGTITNAKLNLGQSLQLPSGTTAQRPSSPVNGMIRYNTTTNLTEEYRGGVWRDLSNEFSATGGTVTTAGGYIYHTFTTDGTFITSNQSKEIEYLVVAGGGGGGFGNGGGGGGAGGAIDTTATISPGSYSVVIGSGGSGGVSAAVLGANGTNSTFNSQTAIGGGGGGGNGNAAGSSVGTAGGSGGGGTGTTSPNGFAGGAGTAGQGNAGGTGIHTGGVYIGGGGGGGKGGVGADATVSSSPGPGAGGAGINWKSLGTFYAAGGGGGAHALGSGAAGGSSIGGNGGTLNQTGFAAVASTGSGGGGGGNQYNGGAGSSGIVIIRYAS
jgi:hypothetical protein